MEHIVFIYQWQ